MRDDEHLLEFDLLPAGAATRYTPLFSGAPVLLEVDGWMRFATLIALTDDMMVAMGARTRVLARTRAVLGGHRTGGVHDTVALPNGQIEQYDGAARAQAEAAGAKRIGNWTLTDPA